MKKTVLEKENKYNKKKTKNLKVLGVATIYTLALSIGLSAAAFAVFNKLKKIELPTETPIESIEPTEKPIESIIPTETPIESIEPTEKPIESIIPTETPIESIEPTETVEPSETVSPVPTPTQQTTEEFRLEQRYKVSTFLFGMPIIWKIKLDGEIKSICVANLYDLKQQNFYIDFFSGTPIVYTYFDENLQKNIYQGIGPFKNKTIEFIKAIIMDDYYMKQEYGIPGYDVTKYQTIGELRKSYEKEIPKEQQVEQLLCFPDDWDDVVEWSSKYEEYYNQYFTSILGRYYGVDNNTIYDYEKNIVTEAASKKKDNNTITNIEYKYNSNTDYMSNVTLSASSKEILNNKLISSGLLKDIDNSNIIEVQKVKSLNRA